MFTHVFHDVNIRIHIRKHVYTSRRIQLYIYIYIYTYIHTYTHTHIHKHTHTKHAQIAARPIKKVAEAKARKKMKAVRAHQKLSNKAEALSNDTDLDEKTKIRALQKLYDKGVAVKRPKSVSVVAKKGSMGVGKKGVKIVDRRMKKDSKSTERSGTRNFKRGAIGKIQRKERFKKNPPPKKNKK